MPRALPEITDRTNATRQTRQQHLTNGAVSEHCPSRTNQFPPSIHGSSRSACPGKLPHRTSNSTASILFSLIYAAKSVRSQRRPDNQYFAVYTLRLKLAANYRYRNGPAMRMCLTKLRHLDPVFPPQPHFLCHPAGRPASWLRRLRSRRFRSDTAASSSLLPAPMNPYSQPVRQQNSHDCRI